VAEGLRRRGIHATSAQEEGKLGVDDMAHFVHGVKLRAAIFTHDHHLVQIALEKTARGEDHCGVIFAEMHRLGLGECIKRLALCSEVLSAEEMMNRVEFL
jgi:hypothetical protein